MGTIIALRLFKSNSPRTFPTGQIKKHKPQPPGFELKAVALKISSQRTFVIIS
jgi:hypothetical protein